MALLVISKPPIGKGQRGMIVAQPKTGKTIGFIFPNYSILIQLPMVGSMYFVLSSCALKQVIDTILVKSIKIVFFIKFILQYKRNKNL